MKSVQYVILSILLNLFVCDQSDANNYDNYLAKLAADSRAVHEEFLRENPRGQYILDQLHSKEYLDGHPVLSESDELPDRIEDAQWRAFLLDLDKARRLASQSPEEGEQFESAFARDLWNRKRPKLSDSDPGRELSEQEITARRTEVAEQNPLWGEHKVSGGSSEIGQWLDYALLGAEQQDVDEDGGHDPLLDFTDSNAIEQINHGPSPFKNDSLPAYCDPPNPCPIGYDPDSLPTPCDPITKYTMELNRDWILSKVASGECTCDTEHMNSCSPKNSLGFSYAPSMNWPESISPSNPYMQGPRRKRLIAKKSFRPKSLDRYPYLKGRILKTVVKKTGPYAPRA